MKKLDFSKLESVRFHYNAETGETIVTHGNVLNDKFWGELEDAIRRGKAYRIPANFPTIHIIEEKNHEENCV